MGGEDTVPLGIEVPALDSFLEWLRRLHKRCADRVALQGLFLQWIHPCDCNGRTSRLVTSALLIQEGVVPALKAHVFAQNKSYGDASTYDGMLFHQLNLSAVFQTC